MWAIHCQILFPQHTTRLSQSKCWAPEGENYPYIIQRQVVNHNHECCDNCNYHNGRHSVQNILTKYVMRDSYLNIGNWNISVGNIKERRWVFYFRKFTGFWLLIVVVDSVIIRITADFIWNVACDLFQKALWWFIALIDTKHVTYAIHMIR